MVTQFNTINESQKKYRQFFFSYHFSILIKKIPIYLAIKKTNTPTTPKSITPTPTPTLTPNSTPKKSSTYPLSFVSGMNYIGSVARGVKKLYNEINPATLTGKYIKIYFC